VRSRPCHWFLVTEFDAPFLVKICGLTTLGDANAAIDAGADAVGLILAASPRQLSLDRALAIAEATRGRVLRTLVFRDHDDAFILDALDLIDPDVVQLHGALGDELLKRLRERDLRIVKALAIATDEFYDFDERSVDAVLIDGALPGSGQTHSWDELSERTFRVPVIAAGGLNDTNVAGVIRDTPVWGVDSASGVESSPGVKDRERMDSFVATAHAAFAQRGGS
jgi:phosphoribosylanthranilate isomerase